MAVGNVPAAGAVAAPVAAAPAAAPVAPATGGSVATSCLSFQNWWNDKVVDWTSKYGIVDVKSTFRLKTTGTDADPADGALKKVMKVFFMALSAIVLYPLAALGCAYNWVKDNLCGEVKANTNGAQAPPVATTTPPAANPAPDAAAVAAAAALAANAAANPAPGANPPAANPAPDAAAVAAAAAAAAALAANAVANPAPGANPPVVPPAAQ